MKKRSREINIFSMSALDLFASALGAFILIAVLMFPFFPNTGDSEERVAEVKAKLNEVENELQQCRNSEEECLKRAESLQNQNNSLKSQVSSLEQQLDALTGQSDALQQCTEELAQCEEKLRKTFLAIVIQWPTSRHDVDLHIIDPTGAEFHFDRKTISGRPGELSADTKKGPGVEIWEVSEAEFGTYTVIYNLYDRHGNSDDAKVKGGLYHRDGHFKFPTKRLSSVGNKLKIAEIIVKQDGDVEIIQQ